MKTASLLSVLTGSVKMVPKENRPISGEKNTSSYPSLIEATLKLGVRG